MKFDFSIDEARFRPFTPTKKILGLTFDAQERKLMDHICSEIDIDPLCLVRHIMSCFMATYLEDQKLAELVAEAAHARARRAEFMMQEAQEARRRAEYLTNAAEDTGSPDSVVRAPTAKPATACTETRKAAGDTGSPDSVVRAPTAKPATAGTETRKARLIIEYISSRKSRMIARSSLTRMFGRDVMETVQSLCEEGVLTESVWVNADGKNPNTYYEVTPAGDVEKAAACYAAKQAKKAPKTHRRESEKPATACTETEKTRLIIEYIDGRKNRMIARGNLIRYFGRDVMKTVQALCEEGVLCEVVKRNADGKNPNLYYEVTPHATSITAEQFIKEN